MATAINIQIRYIPEVSQGSHGGWTAICTELKLAASGETEDEARSRLRSIVESYCNALQRQGLLEKALAESGIRNEPIEREAEEEIVSVSA